MSFLWYYGPRLKANVAPLSSTRIGARTYDLAPAHAYGAFALLLRRSAIANILYWNLCIRRLAQLRLAELKRAELRRLRRAELRRS